MTDHQDENRQNDEQSSMKRRRARIYAERRTVSLRLDPELHQRMMNLCDDLQTHCMTHIFSSRAAVECRF